ncbi:PEPxxWA-CTERM sorting domain-containing protein [Sandarakinorhabdus sp. DWP1-3-1]|uniref:PEPxxWA-CTERM sorting domain-containing protein n=1 Tax=Sandarakinorhabdus sp. DWP1-3-1 TaxID=2804627 RepID=UPI003CE9CEB4
MTSPKGVAALLQRMTRCALLLASLGATIVAVPASAVTTPSWNGYKWARIGQLSVRVGDNVSSVWDPYLDKAMAQWSTAKNIDFVSAKGLRQATPLSCNPVYGGIQACSANYGATGWLGYTNVWLSRGFIVQATVKLNDYYFAQSQYNTGAWRSMAVCHELGHSLGLDHNNAVRTDANTGSCMDYSNDPSGLTGKNGTRSNMAPGAVDFTALNGIYAKPNPSQLASTKPGVRAGDGYSLAGFQVNFIASVPEPQSWALLIGGFGLVGTAMRRQRPRVVRIAAA